MATYQFGIATTESGSYGVIQSVTATYGQEIAQVKGVDGDTEYIHGFEETTEVSCEIVFDTTKTLPTVGNALTLAGGKTTGSFRILSISVVESNSDFCRMSLTLKRWTANGVV